jgi:hypothetical protein
MESHFNLPGAQKITRGFSEICSLLLDFIINPISGTVKGLYSASNSCPC